MTRSFHHILSRLRRIQLACWLMAACVWVVAGCSSDVPEPPVTGPEEEDARPQVNFYLLISEANGSDGSRAGTPTDGIYHPGFEMDKWINFADNDIHFLFFGEDDKLQCEFVPNGIVPDISDSLNHAKRYHVLGTLPDQFDPIQGFKTKMVVLANWATRSGTAPTFSEGMDIDELWKMCPFAYDPATDTIPSENRPIPFFGVTNLKEFKRSDFTFDADDRDFAMFPTIHLLRAMAKVEVILDPECWWKLTGVSMLGYSTSAYPAPQVRKQDDYVHNSWATDYTSTPNVPEASRKHDGIAHFAQADTTGRRYVIYLPEYYNKGTETSSSLPELKIQLHFANDTPDDAPREIRFANYSNGQAADNIHLLRNNWYRFTVKREQIMLDVQPYALAQLDPLYGLERDNEGNIIVRDENGFIIKVITLDKVYTIQNVSIGDVGKAQGIYDNGRLVFIQITEGEYMGSQGVVNYDNNSSEKRTSEQLYEPRGDGFFMSQERVYSHLHLNATDDPPKDENGNVTSNITHKWVDCNIHSIFDDKARVIEQYSGGTKSEFLSGKEGVKCLVSYEGERFGAKTVYYYDDNGKPHTILTVDANGKEEYEDAPAS